MGNITNIGTIDYSNLVYSSNEEDIKQYSLEKGDLLFNRTNSSEWVGKTAIYKEEQPEIYAGYLIRIRSILVSSACKYSDLYSMVLTVICICRTMCS